MGHEIHVDPAPVDSRFLGDITEFLFEREGLAGDDFIEVTLKCLPLGPLQEGDKRGAEDLLLSLPEEDLQRPVAETDFSASPQNGHTDGGVEKGTLEDRRIAHEQPLPTKDIDAEAKAPTES